MTSQDELTISLPRMDISRVLEKVLLGGILFILALPLLGDYGMWLFPIGRDIIFKLTIEFLILVYLAFLFSKKHHTGTLFTPISISLVTFWLVMAVATIFSVQQEFSIWGNIYKNQGLMTWTHYVLFFFLLIAFLNEKRHWNFLMNAAIFVATLIGLIALWQVFQNGFDSRAASTLNNSNYLAAYLVLLLPVAFAFFLKNKTFILGFAVVIQFLALLITQTRGGYLGIAVAVIVFALIYTRQKKTLVSALFIIIALLFIIFTPLGQSFQQKLPNFTDRFLNRQNIISDSGPRLEAWRTGWQGMLARPFFGYGPENFFVTFDEHYSGSQDHVGSLAKEGSLWESWFDKAHNFIFDIGVTTGFLGLFAYISIFVSALYLLSRKLSLIKIGLIASLIGYLAQNLLGFDTIVPGIYLIFLLGYINFISLEGTSTKLKILSSKVRIALFFVLILLSIIFLISFKAHIDILRANHQLNLAESIARNVGIEQAFAAFEKGLEYNAPPVSPNLRRRYAVIALAYYDAVVYRCTISSGTVLDEINCESLFDDSRKHLVRALELQKENAATEWPRFTRNHIYAAQISHILGNYEASDLYFEKALELSPNRASINTEWDRLKTLRKE